MARARALRAVFFDAGNTLVRMNYAAIAEELAVLGHVATPEAVQHAEWRTRVRFDAGMLAHSGSSTESGAARASSVELLLEELAIADASAALAIAAWRETYNLPVGIFNVADPEAEAALALCHDAGLKVGVISNSNGTVRALLATLGFARYLDFVLDSREVGVEKPDARIFALALARADVEPGQAVHVGDLYSVDVRGARGAGVEGILLDPGGYWGQRDCRRAAGPLAAVTLALTGH